MHQPLRSAAGLLLLLAAAAQLAAQVTHGAVSGYVVDPSGRPVAEAEIRATEVRHALVRRTSSGASGFYRLDLGPAVYAVAAAAPGLEEITVKEVTVAVNSHTRVDFQLPVAGRQDAVEVSAAVQSLEAESAELGAVLDERWIQSLPLNRRDFLQLALLTAGVLAPVEDSQLGSYAMHANGAREEYNNFLLDGADNNDPYMNRYVLQPPVDAIQEFKIATNSYSAEYGRSAGGQVNVVTRSGTNQWHGFLYEYLRNRELDARNFFDGGEKARFVRNQLGGGLGGPLARDRSFLFATADFLRERRGFSRLGTVPTPEERRGDLGAAGQPAVDPFTGAPFPGGRIPPERVSPTALRVLELFPWPNRAGRAGNYLAQPVLREAQSQGTLRYDHYLAGRDQITARYSRGLLDLYEPYTEDTDAIPGFGDFARDTAHNAMLHHQRNLGPHAAHSLRVAYSRFSREVLPENHTTDVGRLWGVAWLGGPARSWGYPVLNVAGYSRIGDTTMLPALRHADTYQAGEAVSLVCGTHALRAGGEARHVRLNSRLDLLTRGSLSFSGALSGAGIGDLLLGLPSFTLQSQADNPMTLRTTAYNAWLQHDWKPRPNLTWNVGMRYEYNHPPVDPADRMWAFDFAAGRLVRVGTQGVPRSGIRADRNNIAPRLGLAWSPARDLVVRAGYGWYYDAGMFIVHAAQYFNPPQFNLRVFFPSAAGLLTLADPFPAARGVTPPPSLNVLSPDLAGASMQHWSASVQRSLGGLGSLSLAYAGSKGTHLVRSRDFNQPRPAPGEVQPRRPLGAYGNMLLVESGSNSSYHSLQSVFSRPLRERASVWAVYTLGKSTDDTSAFLGVKADRNFPQDSQDFRAERAASSFDARHRLAVAYIYELPRGNRWVRNTDVRGIATAQSGQPFTPVLRFDNSNTGNTGGTFGWDRPDLLRDPKLPQPSPEGWFDTGAFRVPAKFSFGSAGRNVVRAPGYFSFDASLGRHFPLGERARLTLEAQAFNLINRANFNLPELYADEPATFGRVFSAKAPRQLQFALRLSF